MASLYDKMLKKSVQESEQLPASQPGDQTVQQKNSLHLPLRQSEQPILSQSTGQSTPPSTQKSTKQFTRQSTKQSIEPNDTAVVSKPKGFYITYRLDKRLDNAVKYLQEKRGLKKVDRSLLINALLDTDEKWTDDSLDKLVDPIISILTSRLLS